MPIRSSLAGRLTAAFLALFAGLLLFAPQARAQSCTTLEDCPQEGQPPTIHFQPDSGTFSQPTVPVSITVTPTPGDSVTTWMVRWKGDTITSAFQTRRSGIGLKRVYLTGQVSITAAPGMISVTACGRFNCSSDSAQYKLGSPGVRVTPNGAWAQVASGAAGSYTMWVRNTGALPATFSLLGSCRDAQGTFLSGCGAPSVSTLTLAAGDSAPVGLSFPAPSAGQEITLRLSARSTANAAIEDAGWAELEGVGTGTAPAAMTVALVDLNSSATIARDQCVTVAIAPGAAMECGDLRLAHGLPAVQVLGRTHAPALLYSSAHVSGTARVYADVRLPVGSTVPATVEVKVFKPDGSFFRTVYPGSQWGSGTARRISIVMDALAPQTGVYPYTMQVTAHYTGVSYPVAVAGEVAVVNRALSQFGPGWWLAGLEQVVTVSGNRRLRVGGDGSTRIYSPVATGLWVAARVDRADTLWARPGGGYQRRTPQGAVVSFGLQGEHLSTVNRLKQHTRFTYESGKLAWLEVPRAPDSAGASLHFRFVVNAAGMVTSVEAPDLNDVRGRVVTLGRDALNRITSITDPDSVAVSFGYDGLYAASRTDRRGVQSVFTYGPGRTVSSSRVWLGPLAGDSIIHRFEPVEGRGIAAALPLSRTHTLLDGPRTDVGDTTLIWVGRFAAPRRIRDALGSETLLLRADANFPALVTEVRRPNANGAPVARQSATYDTHGRLQSSTALNPLGDGQNPVTTYTYDDRWNGVTSITAPGQGVVTMGYDTINGNRLWEQVGDATRRVNYRYCSDPAAVTRGMLCAVVSPTVTTPSGVQQAVDSVAYDAWGNVRASIDPLRFHTVYRKDQFGRDTLVATPIDSLKALNEDDVLAYGARSRTGYDIMGRVRWTISTGPAREQEVHDGVDPADTPQETVTVLNYYDAKGDLRRVERQSSPDTAHVGILSTYFDYNVAGRKVEERSSQGDSTTTRYDLAGNVLGVKQRGYPEIVSEYDALGRMVRRTVPGIRTDRTCAPGVYPCPDTPYPLHSTGSNGAMEIPSEVFTFAYDAAGNQVYAENLDSRVSRTYYNNGALSTDTIRMRTYEGLDYSKHVYGLEYRYDQAGRVSALLHPSNLSGMAQADSFAYDAVTGEMTSARSRQGYTYGFAYDILGRQTNLSYPGGGGERTTYDVAGRRLTRTDSLSSGAHLEYDQFQYDARGKAIYIDGAVAGGASTFRNWYSGLGNLVATDWRNAGANGSNAELMAVDAMGSQVHRRTTGDQSADEPEFVTRYAAGTGRVAMIRRLPSTNPSAPLRSDSTYRTYDGAGNVVWAHHKTAETDWHSYGNSSATNTRNWYDAAGQLLALQTLDDAVKQPSAGTPNYTFSGLYSEYRYDALGRRIMERTRRETAICVATPSEPCVSTITRFIWSGDQLLWELRAPGQSSADPEKVTGSGDHYGQVSYFHAGGIDKPLLITKENVGSLVPRDTWRGLFHAGTSPTTGMRGDCTGATPTGCIWAPWPGWQTRASHAQTGTAPVVQAWFGGLVDGMRDASGQMYMRNRYYDPATGQFTQTDPIGLAGGLNSYGFAAGDPVSYSDPYGLDPCKKGDRVCESVGYKVLTYFGVSDETARTFMEPAVRAAPAVALAVSVGRGAGLRSGAAAARSSVHVNIPGPVNSRYGKVDYLLGNVPGNQDSLGKGGFFRGEMGFDETTMGPALEQHLMSNLGSITRDGARINVTGPMIGANGRTANVTTGWRLSDDGRTLNLVTALPAKRIR
ncbi:RHS repeat-associated core domain-containing protein [Longimicrobium terrae]|uniref:RHS repeat-associated protein n=1 Tax=Longimicrobium terrae TaxID=1639882 RepID=A0A841H2T3_9BACT|nr:RHS repeat-associated core domain-containing protein [Longimicrobium terrae]MBB4637842.1 RHS repeat-associated protein [Longimicrobium terrae]MBB6072303.1 RHS repeat-associated protein [Longimicrobium terrae]NNC31223.1 RHS repeat-associated core domain-containing protein [Longimicrobium terrae]